MNLIFHFIFGLSFVFSFTNCNKSTSPKAPWESNYTFDQITTSNKFSLFNQNVIHLDLKEISGLACGIKNGDYVFMIEDKGNENAVYVFNQLGAFITTLYVNGLENIDWEDIAVGPGPVEGESYIYIADIGDNNSERNNVRIIRFIEPDLSLASESSIAILDHDIINFKYSLGPRDAEALMINPNNKDLIIMSKEKPLTQVYSLAFPYTSNMNEASYLGLLPIKKIVGGDISRDGQRITIKNKNAIFYWETVDNDILKTIFHNTPKEIAYVQEPQGESIGFSNDGKSYFTITETKGISGAEPILYHYKEN